MRYLLHVLAQLEQELRSNLPKETTEEFYQLGFVAMQNYLKDHPISWENRDRLINDVGINLDEEDDVATAIFETITNYVVSRGQWKNLVEWFETEALPKIEETVGYEATDISYESEPFYQLHPPVNLKDIQKRQLEANIEDLQEAVMNGLQDAEEHYLEKILFEELHEMLPVEEEEGIPIEIPLELETEYATA
jgi:hypothetical protein